MPRLRFCKAPWEGFERPDGTHDACYCAHPNLPVNARGLHVHSGERVAGCEVPADPDGEMAMLRDAVDTVFGNAPRRRAYRVCKMTRSRVRYFVNQAIRMCVRAMLYVVDILS
jgi:hypothetical protein